MNTKHTPGPWEAFGPVKFTVYGGDPKVRIAVIDYCTGAPTDEHDANGRLIAAAPDLLAALRLAQEAMRAPLDDWKGEIERKALDAARAAIAKAEGKQ
jgi:hypothetical protein